jgi:iron(III) transport system ATP-binding protein
MSIAISNLRKAFGRYAAVDDVSLDIAAGEFLVVLGPSGCGKSTLLRLIAGLDRPDCGRIAIDGQAVVGPGVEMSPEARAVGVVFQSYALWPHMTVRDNVAFPAEARGLSRTEARRDADRHLATVDLAAFADRLPAALSGGQRQRTALARCLAGGARTILMDEPLANLDPHLRARMEAEIAAFHRQTGVTTLYITHDQREAMAMADRIAVMENGRFLQVAPPQEIHDRPACESVARFIGRAAVLDAAVTRDGEGWAVRAGQLSARADGATREGPGRIMIRPGDVVLTDADGAAAPARLRDVFYRGGSWEALADVDDLAEPLPVASTRLLRNEQAAGVTLRRAWVLPG